MRAFILALALTFTVSLTACGGDEVIEEGAPAGDQEDVIGDGEVFDEAGEPEGNVLDGDMDGEISDDIDATLEGAEEDVEGSFDNLENEVEDGM